MTSTTEIVCLEVTNNSTLSRSNNSSIRSSHNNSTHSFNNNFWLNDSILLTRTADLTTTMVSMDASKSSLPLTSWKIQQRKEANGRSEVKKDEWVVGPLRQPMAKGARKSHIPYSICWSRSNLFTPAIDWFYVFSFKSRRRSWPTTYFSVLRLWENLHCPVLIFSS